MDTRRLVGTQEHHNYREGNEYEPPAAGKASKYHEEKSLIANYAEGLFKGAPVSSTSNKPLRQMTVR